MSEIYNEEYYKNYDVGVGKVDYAVSEFTKDFLTTVAKRIVDDFHPRTVFDAGCAMGHLVAALRDLGVEAYGIDISSYAISNVRPDIKPFCAVGSLTDPFPPEFPQHFDLVTNLEVIEHLYAEDGEAAIRNLCSITDTVLFCSTPDDFKEPTHLNVQQREYWSRLFAENGMLDDLTYRPTYLTPYAVCYRKQENFVRQIEDYERNIRLCDTEIADTKAYYQHAMEEKEKHIQNQNALLTQQKEEQAALAKQLEQHQALEQELKQYKKDYFAAIEQKESLKVQAEKWRASYQAVSSSFFWKATKPTRELLDTLKKNQFLLLCDKGAHNLKQNGVKDTWAKAKEKYNQEKVGLFSKQELKLQRAERFPKNVKFSIVVPLYNTPKKFLCEMIESVLLQTYSNWELCMADGSDAAHSEVGKICGEYAKKDPRIRYRKLEKNMGISGNTNACLAMATGDYIGLFDHDDLLHPAALHEVMKAICDQNADFIYTDETTFHHTPKDAFCPHYKPDYAPDTLRTNNYICHFTVFHRNLLQKAGGFRPECDGSQDYDMVLRLTELATNIVHIPEILYYWRAHEGSVAESVGAKPYVIQAAHKALEDHLQRVGLKGEVLDTVVPSMYRIRYQINGTPLVSIIIPNKDYAETLKTCIDSIRTKSSYQNYEIIIVENNSEEEKTFQYYEELKKDSRIQVVSWAGKFNYSAINNFGAQYAHGEYLLLLNNDTEVISPNWIQEMLMFAQRNDVGAVGAKLYYSDDTVQHAGLGIGLLTLAGHLHREFERQHPGYMGRLIYAQDLSGVTAACVMIRRDVWDQVKGLDEKFQVAFNDVDLCMRIRQAGYLIVWTPYAELYHYESKSRGLDDTPEKKARFESEVLRFQERWAKELKLGDPYYNPNFSLDREDFSIDSISAAKKRIFEREALRKQEKNAKQNAAE